VIRPILLDTCAAIWIARGERLRHGAEEAIAEVEVAGGAVALSPITAWEIGVLVARGRVSLARDPLGWFNDLVATGFELADLTPGVLIASSFLPGGEIRDPADRILVATARAMNYRLMTRDSRLLDYARSGCLTALPC
jgi:PIN domain nuclease of toxin-antitoxin system